MGRPGMVDPVVSLDPGRSFVVESCAGSGKTWLLVSRLLRLLLAGAAPGSLLAITFTRKAAGEMRSRLDEWLQFLATAADSEVREFLKARGIAECELDRVVVRARDLLERVTTARPGPLITTFHGWFLHVLARAPLVAQTPGQLIEDTALLVEETWDAWLDSLRRPEKAALYAQLQALFAAPELPFKTLREQLLGFLAARTDWLAWAAGAASDPNLAVAENLTELEKKLGVTANATPVETAIAEPGFVARLHEYRALLERSVKAGGGTREARYLADLQAALALQAEGGAANAVAEALISALLRLNAEPRDVKVSKALGLRLGGAANAERYVALYHQLAETLAAAVVRAADGRAVWLHAQMLPLAVDLLTFYQAEKARRDALDYNDAEWFTDRLLNASDQAEALQARLDARWQHLLLDEFQDANPLQWRILRAWLDAYGDDAARPTVFMVGDPKQSIYRFRRADARLFAPARDYLCARFGAGYVSENRTRRCAPAVVAWVNATFAPLGEQYPAFAPHIALAAQRQGGVCVLPVEEDENSAAEAGPPNDGPWRNPLREARAEPPLARQAEAAAVAAHIAEQVGRLQVEDAKAATGHRPARYGDLLILCARRRHLEAFEAALRVRHIPFLTGRRGGLLDALEVQDVLALLRVLVQPHDDLALAQVLRSPIYSATDADLLTLAEAVAARTCVNAAGRARRPAWYTVLTEAFSDKPGAQRSSALPRAAQSLPEWRALAQHLPPHDILDRLYHGLDLEARYAAAVPPDQVPGVLANLRAVLGLGLKLGGGRYPSLPQFIDRLRALQRQAGDEAPDEAPAAVGDVVRILTIHAAKGLEAPVVYLIKADESGKREGGRWLVDWPPQALRPRHFSLLGSQAWRGSGRTDLVAEQNALATQEALNLLYVAMTRAQQLLVISGTRKQKKDVCESSTPAGSWLALVQAGLDSIVPPGPMLTMASPDPDGTPSRPLHTGSGGLPAVPVLSPVGTRRTDLTAAAEWGVWVHRYLELHAAPAALQDWLQTLPAEVQTALVTQAEAILVSPAAQRFFAADEIRQARNEVEYVDADGLHRIDRLVERADGWWIVDYKTGGLAEANLARRSAPHRAQLLGYARAVCTMWPGQPVHAAVLYADGAVFEWPNMHAEITSDG